MKVLTTSRGAVRIVRGRKGYDAEEAFALQLKVTKLPVPERQYQPALAYGRKWAVDFAWPGLRLIVEIDGAPHRIKERFLEDQKKRLALAALGWTVVSFSPAMVRRPLALMWVRELLTPDSPPSVLRGIAIRHGILKGGEK